MTFAPSAANSRAVAAPIPCAAPLMIATLPAKRAMSEFSLAAAGFEPALITQSCGIMAHYVKICVLIYAFWSAIQLF
jgi:hypothetical protein